jgi:hypothetical protein
MTNHEIFKKLIGPIRPVGKTEEDDRRFDSLIQTCELVDLLIGEIKSVASISSNGEFSIERSRRHAKSFIKILKADL